MWRVLTDYVKPLAVRAMLALLLLRWWFYVIYEFVVVVWGV